MLVVRGRRIVLFDGERPASLHIDRGCITAIGGAADVPAGADIVDVGDLVVSPGVVDTHVHVNEPGRTEWEGFETATRAAAAGGVTTIVDMPLNSVPVTTTVTALKLKAQAAAGHATVDYAFWGGVVPGNTDQLVPLARAGARGFKCFLVPSGIDEFSPATELDLCRETRCPVHIVHVSAADTLERLRRARDAGLPVTAETCPHYLTFAAEEILDGATAWKCAPPIRERSNRERLWEGLADGTLDLVASDHSPAPAELKCLDTGDFVRAWGGVASLELGLAATWTGARVRGRDLGDLGRWCAERPARLAGLTRKGRIAPGCDADLVVFDPDARFTVESGRLQQRHPVTPYAGMVLQGVVRQTFVRGTCVYEQGEFPTQGFGRWLR